MRERERERERESARLNLNPLGSVKLKMCGSITRKSGSPAHGAAKILNIISHPATKRVVNRYDTCKVHQDAPERQRVTTSFALFKEQHVPPSPLA